VNFHTLAARGGRDVPSASRPLTPPIYQTNVYVFEDMDTVESVWESKKPGFVYGRYGTGNHAMLEELVAALEGAEAAVACASGMGATTALLLGLFSPGDHLVSARDLYGSTAAFLADEGRRLGVETEFVDATDAGAILKALRPHTRAVFVEAVSNPLLRLVDVPALAPELARRGIDLIVDASMASPAVFRPLEHGATMVMHSLTKFISGHGDVTGGLVAGRTDPMARVRTAMIRAGTNLGPFDAWLATRGARTLAVRMERQCATALALAQGLERLPGVSRVYYPGLPSHAQHALAHRLMPRLQGAMVSFDLGGGVPAVERLMARARLVEFAPSFGDVATTWTYPARTSHRRISDEEKAAMGIGGGLVRMSVGLEDPAELMADLERALA
jgi:cystathionine beta-lyase/cystathionine gamma-synthase